MTKKNPTELAYLRATVQNATAVGLVIVLYDLLVADLERAIAAIAQGDIEQRTAEIKHAFLILQQLEGSLEMEKGGDAAKHLSNFYSVLRCKILEAHIKINAELLKRQIELILSVRQAWQQVDSENQGTPAAAQPSSSPEPQQARAAAASGDGATTSASWTA